MPKIAPNGKMLQQSIQILKRLAIIVVMLQLLASARAGVIKKREIMTTTVIAPKETEILNKKKEEIETKLPIAKEVDVKWNDTKEATKNFQSDSIVKSQENEVETVATKLEKDNTSEDDERVSSMDLGLAMKKGTAELTESVKENDMSDDYMDFREESIELKGLEDLTTLAPETGFSTLSNELFQQNTELNLNSDSYGTTVPTATDKSPVESENSTASVSLIVDTTANIGLDIMATTISPNIAENLAIAMQNIKELHRSKNITQIQHKDDSEVLSNDIITPTAKSSSEKRGKFINDNSTNQFNLLNTSEVRTLLSMKTIPVKPTVAAVPENHTLHEKISDQLNDQGKNISSSAMSSGNSEKSLLDWTQIMMNENLSSTEGYQLQNISAIFDGTELLHQETKPFQRLSQAHTTVLPPADTNSIVALHENESSFSATTENNEIDVTTNLPTAKAKTTTTTNVSLHSSTTVATPQMHSTSEVTAASVASATTTFPSPTHEPKQSSQPLTTSPATTTRKSTDLLISTEFLSTTTKPTAFPPPSSPTTASIDETTVLSSSFPPNGDDNENKAKQSDKIPNETATRIGLSSATTTTTTTTADLLSSDLSSPAPQETTDMPMENTTNKASTTTQATAIKSVLDTPKNVSTAINEASIATTTTVMEPMQSSTRQPPPPLPENNLIMNTHPPQTAYDNDNHDEVTVKTNHHNNESYDDDERRTTTNATQVVGEEATLELSSNSATTVSRSEASAESTTALAESSRNVTLTESTTIIASRTITTATPKTTTTTTLELTTLTPNDVTLRENENSHSTPLPPLDSQIVTTTDVDLDVTFTTEATTESSFPTSSSTVAAILYVNKDVKSTKKPFVYVEEEEDDFSRATTTTTPTVANPTPAAVLNKTTTESLSNFVEQTTPAPTLTSTTTSTASASVKPNEEDPTVFQNHSIPTDAKQVPSLMPNNSIDMNLIDQPEHDEKLEANKFKIPVVTEVVNVVELTSTAITPSQSTISDIHSSTTERLLISLLDDSTPTTITSSSTPTTSHEVYEVVATTEVVTKNPAATITTSSTTTAINEPTVAPADTLSSTLDTRMIAAATLLPTTMLPPTITLEPENVAVSGTGIGGPHSQPDPVDSPEMDVNVIIAISISVIGIIALILLVAFLYVVRKRQKQMSYGHRCRPVSLDAYSMDNVSVYNSVRRKSAMRSSKRSYGNVAFDDPSLTHNVLTAVELGKFMEKRSNIFEEFKYVPQIIARPDEVPAGCEDKNRYANVIPIPETRVQLQRQNDDEKSEYINANYVRGPRDSPNYYIACQAPLESTVADFWRMIWEQKSRVIIQATDLVENGIEKCAEYLPPSVTLDNHTTFLDFQVTLKHREVKDKYAISTLILKNTLVNASREITHYWYKWPETGVPAEEAPIIAMLLEARCSLKTYAIEEANELKATSMSKSTTTTTLKTDNSRETSSATSPDNQSVNEMSNGAADNRNSNSNSNSELNTMTASEKNSKNAANNQGPLTVHCSPGTGRTGTIIGCDIAIRSLETPKRNVDIPQIIYYVRRGRASAVQTKEQYEFIYKVANMYASKITNVSNET